MAFSANAQIVNIPDANFKARLLAASPSQSIAYDASFTRIEIDINNDNEIQVSEAATVCYLYVSSSSIINLTGLESFVNLKNFSCNYNQIASFNLSGLMYLEKIYLSNNVITSFNLSNLPILNLIDCGYNNLTTLALSSLPSLKELTCNYNASLSNLNLTNLPVLETLNCDYDNLSTLNVNNLTNLKTLNFSNNHISSINLNGLTNLQQLDCNQNQLISLNLSGLNNISGISCASNQLTALDITNLTNLHGLNCGGNQITALDFTNATALTYLVCSYNQLQTLDVSNSPNLSTCLCRSNNITSLYLKNGYNYTLADNDYLNTYGFPQNPIAYVCADENKIPSLITYFNSPTIEINTYCSFIPGGTFYSVQGTGQYDLTNNGCDSSDMTIAGINLILTDASNLTVGAFSNTSGNYAIPMQAGMYSVIASFENPTYFNVSPSSVNVNFPTTVSPCVQNFCITANGSHNDLEVVLFPVSAARPGFDASYKISYKNKGTTTQNGVVNFAFDDAVLDFVSANSNVSSQVANSLSWTFSNLLPFETREILFVLNLNSSIETPPVNAGDVLHFTATVNGNIDETPNDTISVLNQLVVNSVDPNNKTCLEGNTISPSMVGQYVHYVIRFENNGTANAENIVVKDLIDTTKFNVTTLIPISSSHTFVTKVISTNKVEFIFENINLAYDDANNDGYIAFKIKTKPTLVVDDAFSNSANIYFDYNAPIVTNNATTTITALATQDFEFENYFNVYPVPANSTLNIETKTIIGVKSIEIYNQLGQMVLVIPNAETVTDIDISDLKTGVYFIKLNTDKGKANSKFVKE